MGEEIYTIFYSQWFSFLIAVVSGVFGFIYFEIVNKLGLLWKYALVIGAASMMIGTLTSVITNKDCDILNAIVFNCEYSFTVHKFVLIGYSFLIYGILSFLIIRNKRENPRE